MFLSFDAYIILYVSFFIELPFNFHKHGTLVINGINRPFFSFDIFICVFLVCTFIDLTVSLQSNKYCLFVLFKAAPFYVYLFRIFIFSEFYLIFLCVTAFILILIVLSFAFCFVFFFC